MAAVSVSAADLQCSRELSKSVFGQELRLGVTAAIGRSESGVFSLTDIVEALGVRNASSVQVPLKALLDAGFIERVPSTGSDRTRWYSRRDATNLWQLAEELMARARASSGLDKTPERPAAS